MMVGGYYSFQGINAGARYRGTPVEDVLPVTILPWDDRVEVPEGFRAEVQGSCRPSDPRGPRHRVAAPAGLQRSRAEGGGGASAQGPGRCGWTSPAGDGRLRHGPRHRLDLGHWPALVPARLRLVGGLRPPVAAVPLVADAGIERFRANGNALCLYRSRQSACGRRLREGAAFAAGHGRGLSRARQRRTRSE